MADAPIDWAETFARARAADIEQVAGVKLWRSGQRLRGECPICGASKGKRADGAFSVDPRAGLFKCWGCGEGGDVVDLELAIGGGTLREAAARLAGGIVEGRGAPAAARVSAPERAGPSSAERVARETLRDLTERLTLNWEPLRIYLRARGISPAFFNPERIGGLMFHPATKWGWDDRRKAWLRWPAMIGHVQTAAAPTGGLHATYLTSDFSGKARLEPAKRMWGAQRDVDGRPGGVWLSHKVGPGPLIVGEGIESTLSAMQLWSAGNQGQPCRGVATLSLGALQGGWVLDRFGRLDPAAVSADPERPAFTWPDQDQVLIAVDRDMSPIEVKVRQVGGGTGRRRLEAEDRARICAGLAVQAWKAAGANDVRVIAPGAGRDFNDELVASGSGSAQPIRPSDRRKLGAEW